MLGSRFLGLGWKARRLANTGVGTVFVLVCTFMNLLPLCLCECKLLEPMEAKEAARAKDLLNVISPLEGSVFETEDAVDKAHYKYKVSICGDVKDPNFTNSGAVQYITNDKTNHSLGRYDMADITGGTGWMLLSYYGGDAYNSNKHCNAANRTTKIMIVCNPAFSTKLKILDEKHSAADNCYYLFELGSNVVCHSTSDEIADYKSGLSSGSVFCILFFVSLALYLFGGVLYKRFMLGAKGLEQIPNYEFWKDFGNLQADGCDYACRWGQRRESNTYRGIDDHTKLEEERDDQLLNM